MYQYGIVHFLISPLALINRVSVGFYCRGKPALNIANKTQSLFKSQVLCLINLSVNTGIKN